MSDDQMEKSLKRIPGETVVFGLVFGLLAALFFDPISGLLVLAGAVAGNLSFLGLKGFVDRWLTRPKSLFVQKALLLYVVRLGLICLVFLIIILLFKKKIFAFVAGFSLIMLSVMVEALINLVVSTKKWKV